MYFLKMHLNSFVSTSVKINTDQTCFVYSPQAINNNQIGLQDRHLMFQSSKGQIKPVESTFKDFMQYISTTKSYQKLEIMKPN